ncbi:MAG: hydrogenase maturation nickel metallochaperone HypA [Desulfovermiculus sp.]|nr:hydrogenase maturation nickel metallochaperone HypA [Desulfovermiculus sp.]
MHELPVMREVLRVVLKHAHKHGVEKVYAVRMRVGELSDLEEEWMQRYFDHLTKGSLAEGAVLKIERVPATMQCQVCGHRFHFELGSRERIVCPQCADPDCTLVSGREYTVVNLEAV